MYELSNHGKLTKEQWMNRQIRVRTIRSFVIFFLLLGLGGFAFAWLYNQPQGDDNVQPTLRRVLNANDHLCSLFFSKERKSKAFKKSEAAAEVRVNGDVGMDGELDTSWRLRVARAPGDTLVLTIDDLKALPKTEVVFDFKCVEGWSQVTWWGGVRFSDFLKKYNLAPQTALKYVGMVTPDEAYYVGNDMPSMLQPQTILCYEMNGAPLPQDQGYPLRLIIPVKYGIKHLKRIGTIYFSNDRPHDYWAEQGYDYFAGL